MRCFQSRMCKSLSSSQSISLSWPRLSFTHLFISHSDPQCFCGLIGHKNAGDGQRFQSSQTRFRQSFAEQIHFLKSSLDATTTGKSNFHTINFFNLYISQISGILMSHIWQEPLSTSLLFSSWVSFPEMDADESRVIFNGWGV